MVDSEKVYLMTKAALFEQKEEKGALKIVSYRRKDYILYHMLLVMLSATVAYGIFVGLLLFMVIMANESIVLNVGEMLMILFGVIAGYAIVLIFYFLVSHKYFGEKHVKARQDVKKYVIMLNQLKEYRDRLEKQGHSV